MHYDFILVGAGTAGCVLANRLSADPAVRVLLLEAGGSDRGLEVAIPAAFRKLFKGRRDWRFTSEPEPTAAGRELYIPRGRMLGGSSSMNAMIYVRGNRRDYDGWRDGGCPGWGYLDLLPLFKRGEDQARGPSRYHGAGGELAVADPRSPHPLSAAFVEAAIAVGGVANPDFNGAEQDGFGFYQLTQRRGARASAADGFLRPALGRSNLEVVTRAPVQRLFIESGRAYGLEYRRGRRVEYAFAESEIVLTAGAIQSPQLLMLSGVGPAAELEELGLEVHADLPVGRNLHDQPVVGVMHFARRTATLDVADTLSNLALWGARRRGPLTSNVAEAGGFARSRPGLEAPDLQFHFAPSFFVDHGFGNPEGCGFTVGVALVAPRSRGRLTLRSTDPAAAPRIRGDYLRERSDVAALIEGMRRARTIAAAGPFDRFRGPVHLPAADVESDADLERFVRERFELLYHPAGTCRMGSDENAVVDPQLRVRGVDGLRVADASVMPAIVRGNTNAPTVAIAERAADLLLG